MKLAIGSDHAGYPLKVQLLDVLRRKGHEIQDYGSYDEKPVDFPDIAKKVTAAILSGEAERGIMFCGTGVGAAIACNKVRGIRCALCTDETMARLTREHNDSNMLALGGRIVGTELAKAIVSTWLTTEFSKGTRHIGRIGKIEKYEA